MDSQVFAPTEEQERILDFVEGTSENLQIQALAGCGKTSTLTMIQDVLDPPILALAFNSTAAANMRKQFLPGHEIRTFNSLGLAAWNKANNIFCIVEKDKGGFVVKTSNLFREEISKLSKPAQNEAWDFFSDIKAAVDLAKSYGYVPPKWRSTAKSLITTEDFWRKVDVTNDIIIELTDAILTSSIPAAYKGNIDFNDQCYMPALFGGAWPKVTDVLVDEEQDLNPINDAMLGHFKTNRVIAVGDPWQSIYAFRGAIQGVMTLHKERFNMTVLPLSVSFRCRQVIVENARWRAPNFKWIKPGGRVAKLRSPSYTSFPDGCAIVCRNNAPLFKLALALLSRGRSVSVGGSDIGPRIVGLLKKLGREDMTRDQTLGKIEEWRQERLEAGSTVANDTADCMRVFVGIGKSLGEAITFASDLLKRKGTITLLTGHKSKGLEWPVVYHLDTGLIKEDEQDLNLRYVMQTRAMDTYYEISSEEIQW